MPISRKYDKDFFKTWTGDMAYVLGFLYADGNVIQNRRGAHFISAYSADKEIVEGIRTLLGSNHKISERLSSKGGSLHILQIGSKEMFNDLGLIGLIPNKAKRMRLPSVPGKYLADFIRGYFDGDGNVWVGKVNKNRVKPSLCLQATFTSCSFLFLTDLLNVIKMAGVKGGSLHKSKRGNYARLSFSTLGALKLYEIMYNGSCALCLSRKRSVFERFIKMRV